MSKRQVNIFLPLHVPECSYRQTYVMEVLKLLQWWRGHKWLSIIPPCWCRLKRRKARRPCRLRWTTRPDLTHGTFVANHGPWCHVRGHNAPRLGTQSIPASANWNGVAKALKRKRSNSSCLNAQELLKRGYAKLELDENYGQAMQAWTRARWRDDIY